MAFFLEGQPDSIVHDIENMVRSYIEKVLSARNLVIVCFGYEICLWKFSHSDTSLGIDFSIVLVMHLCPAW